MHQRALWYGGFAVIILHIPSLSAEAQRDTMAAWCEGGPPRWCPRMDTPGRGETAELMMTRVM